MKNILSFLIVLFTCVTCVIAQVPKGRERERDALKTYMDQQVTRIPGKYASSRYLSDSRQWIIPDSNTLSSNKNTGAHYYGPRYVSGNKHVLSYYAYGERGRNVTVTIFSTDEQEKNYLFYETFTLGDTGRKDSTVYIGFDSIHNVYYLEYLVLPGKFNAYRIGGIMETRSDTVMTGLMVFYYMGNKPMPKGNYTKLPETETEFVARIMNEKDLQMRSNGWKPVSSTFTGNFYNIQYGDNMTALGIACTQGKSYTVQVFIGSSGRSVDFYFKDVNGVKEQQENAPPNIVNYDFVAEDNGFHYFFYKINYQKGGIPVGVKVWEK